MSNVAISHSTDFDTISRSFKYSKRVDFIANAQPLIQGEPLPLDEFASLYRYYKIEKETEVIDFIIKYPFLLSILEEAPNQIYRIFGKGVILCLELHHDPKEGWDELFIVIKSTCRADEAINFENRLAEEWFLPKAKETKGMLNIIEEPL